jgi:2-hydroxy-3-oxopropionate reductase
VTAEVGFIGLGKMGGPMARNLLKAGIPVVAWNRTASKAHALAELGARAVDRPRDAALPVVLTVLIDLPDVEEVLAGPDGLLAGWAEAGVSDPLLVVMATVSPTGVKALAERLAEHGVRVIDAPVSGGDVGAERGTLSIMVGGESEDVARAQPYFEAMGTTVRHLGPIGTGQVAKSCNQIIVAATAITLSEAMVYARRSGLDLQALVDLLQGGLADSELLRQKGWRLLEREYTGGGALANQVKDLRFALVPAQHFGVALPGSAARTDLFAGRMSMGYGEEDHTAAQRVFELLAGEGRDDDQH